jgi:hypothetical protein
MSASMRGSLHQARLDRAQYRHHSRSTRQRPSGRVHLLDERDDTEAVIDLVARITTYDYNSLNMLGDSMSRGKAADGTSGIHEEKEECVASALVSRL